MTDRSPSYSTAGGSSDETPALGPMAPPTRVPRPAAVRTARIVGIAMVGEGGLALAGAIWCWARRIPMATGPIPAGIAVGVGVALALAGVQYWLLRHAPPIGLVQRLRTLYRDVLEPLFRDLPIGAIVIVSVLAGVGEELMFRGAMQPEWGWLATSLIFGACHIGGRETVPLGLWAAATGALLGWLAIATGGLLAPIVAHALYDALALGYIRWSAPRDDDRPGRGAEPIEDRAWD